MINQIFYWCVELLSDWAKIIGISYELINIVKDEILSKDQAGKGFNFGTNIGKVSGQSIFHCHMHLIPRRDRDVENPQGGVRSVIPHKQHYKRKK